MTVTEFVKDKMMLENKRYAETAADHSDYWEQHIKFVVKEALILYGYDQVLYSGYLSVAGEQDLTEMELSVCFAGNIVYLTEELK